MDREKFTLMERSCTIVNNITPYTDNKQLFENNGL